MILVDTSSWVHALRKDGDPQVKGRVQQLLIEGSACWCDMVRVELIQGAVDKREKEFLQGLDENLTLLPISSEVWQHVAELSVTLRKAGNMVPFTDRLIFSCAAVHEVKLEHVDQHFDQIREVVSPGR